MFKVWDREEEGCLLVSPEQVTDARESEGSDDLDNMAETCVMALKMRKLLQDWTYPHTIAWEERLEAILKRWEMESNDE